MRLNFKSLKLISIVSSLIISFSSASAFATTSTAAVSPEVVVKTALESALSELKARRSEFEADKSKLHEAINRTLGSVVNFELFSKAVLGNHWRTASDSQRTEFVGEFKKQLLGTYASAVFEYSDQKINYLPFSNPENKDRVKVKAEFITASGGKVPMTFSMNIRKDTSWKVYNIKIQTSDATIELIPLFRSDYRERVASKGLDKVIAEMKAKNSQR